MTENYFDNLLLELQKKILDYKCFVEWKKKMSLLHNRIKSGPIRVKQYLRYYLMPD